MAKFMNKVSPPPRLLLGPGPCNAADSVLEAMRKPLVGHLDPYFISLMDEVQEGLRILYGTKNKFTLPISATGSAGMETCLVNLIEPGDVAVVGCNGVFGDRMCAVITKAGGKIVRVEAAWGTALDPAKMKAAIDKHKPNVVAFVHAETSTGVLQPVREIADAAHAVGALVILDCVTSISGSEIRLDDWGVDAAYSGTQKCLAVPPGLSPVSFSNRALAKVKSRKTPVQSWYFDLNLLGAYYGDGTSGRKRAYHHTAPISMIYALHEGIRLALTEGIEARIRRHKETSQYLIRKLKKFGFTPMVEERVRLPQLTSIRLPTHLEGEKGDRVRAALLQRFNIEIGGGLGALAGKVWRIGLMGPNAQKANVDRLLDAMEQVLPPSSKL